MDHYERLKRLGITGYAANFVVFHFRHPEVQGKLAQMALTMKRSSQIRQWGLWSLYTTLRCTEIIAGHGDRYELSNGHIAYYSRLIMRDYPNLDGFFVTRGYIKLPEVPDGRTLIELGITLDTWLARQEAAQVTHYDPNAAESALAAV